MNIHMQRSFIRTIILIGWRLRFTSVVVVKDKVKPSFTTRTTSNNTSLQQCYTTLYNVLRLRLRNCRTGLRLDSVKYICAHLSIIYVTCTIEKCAFMRFTEFSQK